MFSEFAGFRVQGSNSSLTSRAGHWRDAFGFGITRQGDLISRHLYITANGQTESPSCTAGKLSQGHGLSTAASSAQARSQEDAFASFCGHLCKFQRASVL